MDVIDEKDLPFSQRTGLVSIPPQLALGKVSDELRRLLWYAVHSDLETCLKWGSHHQFVSDYWVDILRDVNVRVMKKMPDEFGKEASQNIKALRAIFETYSIGSLFDFVEFLLSHWQTPMSLKASLASAFVEARAAYRVVDAKRIIAVGNEHQADSIIGALIATSAQGARGSRAHLIEAAACLRVGEWADSVRESIHAVEAIAVDIAPDNRTLGSALSEIEKQGHLHGALKTAFSNLYGYTSDEEGVRHALVLSEKANVDEADALFMLGACASFVTFLTMRRSQ